MALRIQRTRPLTNIASHRQQIPVGDIDPKSVKARVENGVLTVTLPAPTEPQPVKIAIQPGS